MEAGSSSKMYEACLISRTMARNMNRSSSSSSTLPSAVCTLITSTTPIRRRSRSSTSRSTRPPGAWCCHTFSTSAAAAQLYQFITPKNLIPGQHVVPLIADRKADSTVRKALARLGNTLTTAQLTELNRQVDKDKKDPEDVANAYAKEHGLVK